MSLDSFEASHVCGGRNLIRANDEPDLRDNRPLWEALWTRHREELIAGWIRTNPGSRPPAFWEFDSAALPGDEEGEADYLDRLGLIGPEELEAIREKSAALAAYNRGRSPKKTAGGFYADNYIPPSELHRFAARRGLLTADQAMILGL